MDKEYILNLWAFFDVDSRIVLNLAARAYLRHGSDEEKMKFLEKKCLDDFKGQMRYKVPDNVSFNHSSGTMHIDGLEHLRMQVFDDVIKKLEHQLKVKIPSSPLVLITCVSVDNNNIETPIIDYLGSSLH